MFRPRPLPVGWANPLGRAAGLPYLRGMGLTTSFVGEVFITPPLDRFESDYLRRFNKPRRMRTKLGLPPSGCESVGKSTLYRVHSRPSLQRSCRRHSDVVQRSLRSAPNRLDREPGREPRGGDDGIHVSRRRARVSASARRTCRWNPSSLTCLWHGFHRRPGSMNCLKS